MRLLFKDVTEISLKFSEWHCMCCKQYLTENEKISNKKIETYSRNVTRKVEGEIVDCVLDSRGILARI